MLSVKGGSSKNSFYLQCYLLFNIATISLSGPEEKDRLLNGLVAVLPMCQLRNEYLKPSRKYTNSLIHRQHQGMTEVLSVSTCIILLHLNWCHNQTAVSLKGHSCLVIPPV